MNNKSRFCIILAAILAAFCALSFAIPFVKNGVFWLAFVFGVVAIAVQLYSFPKAFGQGKSAQSKFYGFPIARLTVIYLVAQLAVSFLFMGLAKWAPLWAEVLVSVLLLLAALIGFVSADAMREEIERQDTVLKKDVTVMRGFQSQIANLSIHCPEECREELTKLADAFRYSDPVSHEALTDIENELSAMMGELQKNVTDGDAAAVKETVRKLSLTLAERNRLCKLNKN